MSSLRNSLHRRNHKERSQLSGRAKLGILEKHKDYVLRARDYHSKQDRLNLLRKKAAEKNKDEFYFSMTRQRTVRAVHVQERGTEMLPIDIVKILKTQDENYLRAMRTAGVKKIEKLKEQLSALADLVKSNVLRVEHNELDERELDVLVEAGVIAAPATKRRNRRSTSAKGKHLVFAETPDEAREHAATNGQAFSAAAGTNNGEEIILDLGWEEPTARPRNNRMQHGTSAEGEGVDDATDEDEDVPNSLDPSSRTRLLRELSARLVRDRQLRYAMRELEMQRMLMAKGAARKSSGVEEVKDEDDDDDDDEPRSKKVDEKTWKPRVYKWRLERKK